MENRSCFLKDPKDWDAFEQGYILQATGERVSHLARLADPNDFHEKRLKAPIQPKISNFKRKVQGAGIGMETRQASQASVTQPVRGSQDAERFSDLLPEDLEEIKLQMTLFQTDQNLYTKQADGIRNVLNWMVRNISSHYIETCSPALSAYEDGENEDNIALFYQNLKAACGIDDELRRKQARRTYSEVLNQGKNSKTNWEEWITRWERAMRGGKLRGISEVQHAKSWFDDLQEALGRDFEVFIRVEKSQYKDLIIAGSYQPSQFAANFRQEVLENKKQTAPKIQAGRVAKGAFGPTFKEAKPENKRQNDLLGLDDRRESSKRQRTPLHETESCKLCDRAHHAPNTTRCWVAFPENMPRHLKLSQKQIRDWEHRLKVKPEVQELYESLKTIKRSSSERKD